MTKVMIVEVEEVGGVWRATGREILMDADSPLFVGLGDCGSQAVAIGRMAMPTKMFQQVRAIIERCE